MFKQHAHVCDYFERIEKPALRLVMQILSFQNDCRSKTTVVPKRLSFQNDKGEHIGSPLQTELSADRTALSLLLRSVLAKDVPSDLPGHAASAADTNVDNCLICINRATNFGVGHDDVRAGRGSTRDGHTFDVSAFVRSRGSQIKGGVSNTSVQRRIATGDTNRGSVGVGKVNTFLHLRLNRVVLISRNCDRR